MTAAREVKMWNRREKTVSRNKNLRKKNYEHGDAIV